MKIDILILYEHVQRELKYASILKVLLEREGYSVKIDNVAWRRGLLDLKYKPKLIISPSCQNDLGMNYILHNYVGAYNGGYKILNLYSEQLGSASTNDLFRIRGKAFDIYHIAWGEYRYNIAIDDGLNKNQIRITGSQRLDYAKGDLKKLNVSKTNISENYKLDINKKWILAVGNYSMKDEYNFDYYESIGVSNVRELHDLAYNTYYKTLEWYSKVVNDETLKDKIEFIYRPHPSEIIKDELLNLQKQNTNFHIISDLSISDWAINCDLVYIWTSTSSFEISASKVPIISVVPIELKDYFTVPVVDSIEKADTCDMLLNFTKDILINKNLNYNEKFRNEMSYYYYIGDLSASEYIVRYIKEILACNGNIIKSSFNYFKAFIKTILFIFEYVLYLLNIKINKYLDIRFRDYRSKRYIDNYCKRIKEVLFEK